MVQQSYIVGKRYKLMFCSDPDEMNRIYWRAAARGRGPRAAAMPHFSPVILKRRGGFSGTSKRPPLCALDPEMTMGGPRPGNDNGGGPHCHFRV